MTTQLEDSALDALVAAAKGDRGIDGEQFEAVVDELRARRIQASAEQRLRNSQAALTQLVRSDAIACGDLEQALREIVAVAVEILGVGRASVWRCNEDCSRLTCVDLIHAEGGVHESGAELSRIDLPAYFDAILDQPILAAHDARVDPRTAELWDSYLSPLGVGSKLDASIRVGGRMLGVVCCERLGRARNWSTSDGNFVSALADFTALAIQSHRRLQTEEQLRETIAVAEQRLQTIERQRVAIADLSAPIIDVWDGILAVPIIGLVDSQSSIELTQRLLERISTSRARSVIVDLTGIDEVNTLTANLLLQMLRAARLLGSDCVVSGVSPQIAQTVAQLDIDLREIKMARSLKQALEICMRGQLVTRPR